MDRRNFLKVTGVAAAAAALHVTPAAAQSRVGATVAHGLGLSAAAGSPRLSILEPGTYVISGEVELLEPVVEIGGITNSQVISGSGFGGARPRVASFLTYERFDLPGLTPDIRVLGGRLTSLKVAPVIVQ